MGQDTKETKKNKKKTRKPKKNYNYFKAFEKMTRYTVQAAALLEDATTNYNLDVVFEDKLEDIRRVEHKCDEVVYEIMDQIVAEFLPPIDQEDIISLTYALDDVTDAIEDVFTCIYMFRVDHLRSDAVEFTRILLQSTEGLEEAAKEFSHFKKSKHLKDKVMAVSDLEKEADKLFVRATHELFGDSSLDLREVIIWKDLYERLENCCDAAEMVTKLMEKIQLKNL
ncbi:DUF47 domain-containing protein [Peptococcus simiae]|uniref:DUF47 domain-containing protein n=1 Tax=Peptococcus simiae TaxID=1643805 RepID=UPI0039809C94